MSDSWIIARSPCRIHPSGNLMNELSEVLVHRTGASFCLERGYVSVLCWYAIFYLWET